MLKVNLFFDESGKTVKTMGSLMIPEKVYNCKEIVALNERLRKEEFELHWTKYNGGNSEAKIYKEIVEAFSKYLSLCEFNMIRYDYPSNVNKQYQGKGIDINADIYVENATMYDSIGLHESLSKEMNRQALYRGTNFEINKFEYKYKNEEIGVEFTDVILGVVRNIIENKSSSTRARRKNCLIVEFLKNDEFNKFIRNIKYFEWNYSSSLTRVDFSDYVNIFLSDQEEWINYLDSKK